MRTLAVAGLAALALSLLGGLAPPIDSLSHFRWHIVWGVLALAVLSVLRRRLRLAAALAIPAVAVGAGILPYVWPNAPERRVGATTLLQMNLLYHSDLAPARAAVLSAGPEIVTLQEVTDDHWREIAGWPFAHKLRCHSADTGISTAILSTLPLAGEPLPCAPLNRMTAVRLAFDSGPVWVMAVHASWPWPRSQWRDLPAQEPFLSPLTGPVVIAGDFNAAPWSAFVQTLARLSGTTPVTGIGLTWPTYGVLAPVSRGLGLPIDGVLVSPRVTARAWALAPTASDHRPVLVELEVN